MKYIACPGCGGYGVRQTFLYTMFFNESAQGYNLIACSCMFVRAALTPTGDW